MSKKIENNGVNLMLGPKPLYKVHVKYASEDFTHVMFFDVPVHIAYGILTGQVGAYDEKGNCLYLAQWNLVEYCHVVPNI